MQVPSIFSHLRHVERQEGRFVVREDFFDVPVPLEGSFVAQGSDLSCHIAMDILTCCNVPCASRHVPSAVPPHALCQSPRTFCPATTGLRADVGKARACQPRLLDGELLLLVRAFCPVQRRRTDAVLLLRRTAALVGPAGPFPPIRPKACRRIALSVRATVAKYPSPCYKEGLS